LVGKNAAAIEALASSKPCVVGMIRERIAILAQTKSAASIDCHNDGDRITVQGVATAQSLELANGSTKSVWILATDSPICVVESEDGIAVPQERNVSRLQVVGKPPPTGVAIELKGKLSTGNITQYYAESTAIVATSGRRIEVAISQQAPADRPTTPASVPPPMPSPDVARAAMIADDTGQWAGTIRVDTLKIDSIRKGGAVVCHQSEHGPSCHAWTFDCDRFALLDKMFAHSDYFPPFMQGPNGRSTTPEQNAELQALNAVATKLPATACRLGGVAPQADNPQWIDVRESTGEVKATIDVATIRRDADGNAHARVCLNSEPSITCPASKVILRWYFN
jgi:hypothetical protein